ncbi:MULTISPECIES: ATP-binding protein [Cyanophyceae]|uniref:ATP-binding protein n=1 Tax=Cyanophyceae TaxID=3028117 RepID=UPI0016861C14|nr:MULTISPECIES: ATP-binding protein [Cyanophyceae]MBD1914903.1 GAF domain-containing protein [Phormidium sp. FACHB-77]MBD2028581.1 GAF domain-containing protein [Phormidium sp. FACHB-322]MBD2051775.1 GAF domain-containing protein [Leptolyngbya sp. FACHB-60]
MRSRPSFSTLAAASPADAISAWIMVLSPAAVVESIQTVGNKALPEALTANWVGRSLAEIVSFATPHTLGQALESLATRQEPVQLPGRCPLGSHSIDVQWVLQPLIGLDGQLFRIAATGYLADPHGLAGIPWLRTVEAPAAVQENLPGACAQLQTYSPRLTQITRNVRWTLDLEIIRQQTVEGLGDLFGVNRCLVCSCDAIPNMTPQAATVTAEYTRLGDLPSWQGQVWTLAETPCLSAAAQSSVAVVPQRQPADPSIVAVATRYQNTINGFIVLHDRPDRPWSDIELNLLTDLADQVGTAIAHATLFGESHALAIKLQQANASLMEKQLEFQEARRQAEEARQQAEEASRLKSEFLANTSHELRTPLNGMIGFLRLVLDGMADDPAEQEEFIEEAHKSAIHLLQLINDVLDIAKIEAGKMQIDMGPISLKELLADVENFMRHQADEKHLAFDILLPATRDDITVNGNYQRLLQVLINLVGNAIKFTHEGGVTISAEVKPQQMEYQGKTWPGLVKISVADTGIGVSLEKQDRLFQSFSQVDGDRTRQYGGTGLGLAISQRLVEAMGGVVQFISMGEGLGSTVTFTALLYQKPVVIDKEPVYPPK